MFSINDRVLISKSGIRATIIVIGKEANRYKVTYTYQIIINFLKPLEILV